MNELREIFFDQVGETLVIFDKDLRFADVDTSFLSSLNLKREEIIGKHLNEVSPGIEETPRYQLYLKVLDTGENIFIDEARTHPSLGNYVSRINVFKIGEGIGLAIQNITDLKDAMDELETFIFRSSHDLRSPISSILGLANLAVNDASPNTTDFYFKMIKQKAEQLDSILNRLMETASIRKKDKTIHLIDFRDVIDQVKSSLTHMKGFDQIHFEEHIDVPGNFYSDKRLIQSIFQNLLENAVKYKQDHGKSFIKTEIVNEKGGVKIAIADNGIGIPEALQPNVFNLFFRATNRAMGSGLGLYTIKHAVHKLGGHITLSSNEIEGTTFIIHLPNENRYESLK